MRGRGTAGAIRAAAPSRSRIASRAKKIRLLLLDVDGVLTDGSIILDDQGRELKAFHVRDGHGIKMAQKAGIVIGIITGRTSGVVNVRASELGISEVHQGAKEKIVVYEDILARLRCADDEAAFIGDDVVDAAILRRAGLAVAVADAHPSVLRLAHLVTRAPGGRGAVREVVDLILAAQGRLPGS